MFDMILWISFVCYRSGLYTAIIEQLESCRKREAWLAWTVLLFLLSIFSCFFFFLAWHHRIGVRIIDGLGRVSQKKRIISETKNIQFWRGGEGMDGLAGIGGLGKVTNLR
jgi:hypothetical protein